MAPAAHAVCMAVLGAYVAIAWGVRSGFSAYERRVPAHSRLALETARKAHFPVAQPQDRFVEDASCRCLKPHGLLHVSRGLCCAPSQVSADVYRYRHRFLYSARITTCATHRFVFGTAGPSQEG